MFCSGTIIDRENFSYPLCTGGGQVCDLFKLGALLLQNVNVSVR